MAFKTDTIKLNTGYTTNPAGIEGQLALVGTPGNRVLKLYDDGSWADVSSGGGGGGASELVDLNDVPSAPSTEDTVATVNSSNQLVFGKLTVDNIDASNLLLGAQGFVASDATLMTSAAIENKIEAYGYAVGNATNWDTAYGWNNHADQNYTKNYTEIILSDLTSNVILGTTLNQKFVISSDPGIWKFRLNNPATGYTENTIIEIINLSDYDQIISSGVGIYMYHTNTGLDTINDITIERGQRGLITVSENPATGQNYFFVTSLTV